MIIFAVPWLPSHSLFQVVHAVRTPNNHNFLVRTSLNRLSDPLWLPTISKLFFISLVNFYPHILRSPLISPTGIVDKWLGKISFILSCIIIMFGDTILRSLQRYLSVYYANCMIYMMVPYYCCMCLHISLHFALLKLVKVHSDYRHSRRSLPNHNPSRLF